jgi:ATP-binding cassette subfamily C protein/ATP-binding cassette subfamily C protein LapB
MAIYDQVVGRQAVDMLGYLVAGVAGVACAELALRRLRARAQAHVAARMDYLIASRAFDHVLGLPLASTERAPIGGQVARLREMEALRDLFTSPLAGVILDLPFVVLFLAVIAVLGGWLVLVPGAMLLAFALLGLLLFPVLERRVAAAGAARAERQTFLVEMVAAMRTVRQAGAEEVWAERFRGLSAEAAAAGFRVGSLSAALQDLSQLLMTAAGAAVLVLGADRVMAGELSLGALIAAMALTWRVLSPLQTGFAFAGNLKQVGRGIATLNQLLDLKRERGERRGGTEKTLFSGRIAFRRVILRHSPRAEPALFDVNLSVAPGEVVAVAGRSGSGKSSLLKVALGLYAPQAGTVLLDDIDVRQIDPAELRHAISYVPQNSAEFYGTLGQNLQLANPVATPAEVAEACDAAGLSEDIAQLPDGLDTRIGDHAARTLPPGLSQRLALARAFLRPTPIMLLDEPGNALDDVGDRAFVRAVSAARTRRTVILVTHRPSHMRLADRVVVLERGQVRMAGPPDEIVPQILNAQT